MLAHRDLYEELRLQPTASASEIRSAYRRAALRAHPDKGGSATAFHSIAFAYEVLSCSTSRELYDRAHRQWSAEHRAQQSNRQASWKSTLVSGCMGKAANPSQHGGHGVKSRSKRKREAATEAGSAAKKKTEDHSTEDGPGMGDVQADEKGDGDEGGDGDDPHPEPDHHILTTLKQLRSTLQDLAPTQRREAIAQMPQHLRKKLLAYMSGPQTAGSTTNERSGTHKQHLREEPWSRGTDVRTLVHTHTTSYQVQMRIRHLRMYTRSQGDLDMAISIQMVLIQARHAVCKAGDDVWHQPAKFCNIFDSALADAGRSREQLGLSVFICMKADEWISRCTTITSPVMPLQQAVAAHSRLLGARQTSWDRLKAEWVLLMQQTQQARIQKLSKVEAEAVAENARLELLQRRLKQAAHAVEIAIGQQEKRSERMQKANAKLHQKAIRQKAAAAAAEKRAVRKNAEQKLLAARRRWYQRVDLTMEEILHGAPQACS